MIVLCSMGERRKGDGEPFVDRVLKTNDAFKPLIDPGRAGSFRVLDIFREEWWW